MAGTKIVICNVNLGPVIIGESCFGICEARKHYTVNAPLLGNSDARGTLMQEGLRCIRDSDEGLPQAPGLYECLVFLMHDTAYMAVSLYTEDQQYLSVYVQNIQSSTGQQSMYRTYRYKTYLCTVNFQVSR